MSIIPWFSLNAQAGRLHHYRIIRDLSGDANAEVLSELITYAYWLNQAAILLALFISFFRTLR